MYEYEINKSLELKVYEGEELIYSYPLYCLEDAEELLLELQEIGFFPIDAIIKKR